MRRAPDEDGLERVAQQLDRRCVDGAAAAFAAERACRALVGPIGPAELLSLQEGEEWLGHGDETVAAVRLVLGSVGLELANPGRQVPAPRLVEMLLGVAQPLRL